MRGSTIGVLAFVLWLSAGMLAPASDAETPNPDIRRRFEEIWRNKQVYLLIPREQGEARGLRRRRFLLFRHGRPDSYTRGVTRLGNEVFFDRLRVADINWKTDRVQVVLHRPPYPEEYAVVSARGVEVVAEIHFGGADFEPVKTNDILCSFLILEEAFPPQLRLNGEGPPKLAESMLDICVAKPLEQIVPGLPSSALPPLLGTSLDMRRVSLGGIEYEYQWFGDFHILVLLREEKVLCAYWLSF